MKEQLKKLATQLKGELHYDTVMRTLYATDASVYRELPLAVAIPKNKEDLKKLVAFAKKHNTSLIPRTAGTSLAGQCVGDGIVVDTSKAFTEILEINAEEGWVKVQPGVVRDYLNAELKKHGLFFGPNTSTANRCMIGGMVGNNSCGSTSIVYGTTRDHTMELEVILSDGSEVTFKAVSRDEFFDKMKGDTLEAQLYKDLYEELKNEEVQQRIRKEFPKPNIHRRNTGYAVDVLLNSNVFTEGGEDFNFCKLLCGSEGTLALTTSIKLHVDPLPPKENLLICPHFTSINESLEAVLVGMKHQPYALELMDKTILDCTKGSLAMEKNRYFLEGDPEAVLIIEVRGETKEEIEQKAQAIEEDMKAAGFAYSFPRVYPPKIKGVWDLRKAGLGILSNLPGELYAVAVIEDTAVDLPDLPAYISDFTEMMDSYNQKAIYYAHAGAGELHLRPVLDLKQPEHRKLFRDIATSTAELVKKYDGSLSGEHGDGRVRGEFVKMMVGEENYELLRRLKASWDSQNIFNPGKIVDAPPMDENLRYESGQQTIVHDTMFDFSKTNGILRAAEKCNGSADCRKLPSAGGTMCPSYQATLNEKETTRARANILREFLTNSTKENPFDHKEIKEVLDLCLQCKGCTSECPSSVDMASMKAEFLHQYYKANGVPLRAKFFANFGNLFSLGSLVPGVTNFFIKSKVTSSIMKKAIGVAPQRSMPALQKTTLRKWFKRYKQTVLGTPKGKVYFFCDEFTDFNDTHIGIKGIQLLNCLGYEVVMPKNAESGRTHISKGLLNSAKHFANQNVKIFKAKITEETPLIGIEPSCILSFRDEYPRLVDKDLVDDAKQLAKNALLIDEFIAREVQKGNITTHQFTKEQKTIKLHGHCHQKALSSVADSAWVVGLPENYNVEVIPSGCCGMAGSFGYEAEHYEVSMKVGELVLFPAVRSASEDTIIAAPGTSCRHQIYDGTKREALHPVEVLFEALV